jgi:hypothetical protein
VIDYLQIHQPGDNHYDQRYGDHHRRNGSDVKQFGFPKMVFDGEMGAHDKLIFYHEVTKNTQETKID